MVDVGYNVKLRHIVAFIVTKSPVAINIERDCDSNQRPTSFAGPTQRSNINGRAKWRSIMHGQLQSDYRVAPRAFVVRRAGTSCL
jgi:hypothetical protein